MVEYSGLKLYRATYNLGHGKLYHRNYVCMSEDEARNLFHNFLEGLTKVGEIISRGNGKTGKLEALSLFVSLEEVGEPVTIGDIFGINQKPVKFPKSPPKSVSASGN